MLFGVLGLCVRDALDKLSGCLLFAVAVVVPRLPVRECKTNGILRMAHQEMQPPVSVLPAGSSPISHFHIPSKNEASPEQPQFVHHNMAGIFGELLALLISMCGMPGLHSVKLKDPRQQAFANFAFSYIR